MHSHLNARLKQKGRLRLINQHLIHHRPLAELAGEAGISLRCGYKWLARYRSGGAAALMDRRSVRRTQQRTLDLQHLRPALELRHQRLHLPTSSGCWPLPSPPWQDPEPPGPGAVAKPGPQGTGATLRVRENWQSIHIDVKKLARVHQV